MAIVERDDYFKARISCRSDLTIPGEVKKRLNKEGKKMLKDSCFGVFYDITDVPFQGQLYLHFLLKQDSQQVGEKLLFHVNKKIMEFGPREFALITGLHFGSLSNILESSKFYKSKFGRPKKRGLFVKDIKEAFIDATAKNSKCTTEDALKLGLLWILYGVLLMRDYTSKKIDTQYIHLMDKLEVFNKFPWGRIAYEFLVRDIRISMSPVAQARRLRNKERLMVKGDHIDCFGFAHAIQFWAYETMPCVKQLCAIEKSSSVIPRMLRWTCSTERYEFQVLTKRCFPMFKGADEVGKKFSVLPQMLPTKSELKTNYYKSLLKWEKLLDASLEASSSHRRKRSRVDFEDSTSKQKGKKKRQRVDAQDDVSDLRLKVAGIEKNVQLLLGHVQFLITKMGWKIPNEDEVDNAEQTDAAADTNENEEAYSDSDEMECEDDETECESKDEVTEGDQPNSESEDKVSEARKDESDEAVCDHDQVHSVHDVEVDETGKCKDGETGNLDLGDEGKCKDGETGNLDLGDEQKCKDGETGNLDLGDEEKCKDGETGNLDFVEVDETVVDEVFDELVDEERKKKHKECEDWSIVLNNGGESLSNDQLNPDLNYNPVDVFWHEKAELAFKNWYEASTDDPEEIEITVKNIPGSNHEFFEQIWEKQKWLDERNVDAIFNLVILKSEKWPKLFEQGWTTVDQFFWVMFTETTYNAWVKLKRGKKEWDWCKQGKKVIDYVCGDLPLHGKGLPWMLAESVYGIAHVNKNHWVLYEIRLKHEEVIVYDSLAGSGRRPNQKTLSPFRKMATLLPIVSYDLIGRQPPTNNPYKAWTVTMSRDVPEQADGNSCGIIACKAFECLVSGYPVQHIKPRHAHDYRKSYCLELFDAKNIFL